LRQLLPRGLANAIFVDFDECIPFFENTMYAEEGAFVFALMIIPLHGHTF
jgi:hypothetical protein